MSARVVSTMATTSARSAGGTPNLSSVWATSSMNASQLARPDAQVPVRALHVLAGVFLRTSGGPAQHLGNQIFEACRRYLVVHFPLRWRRLPTRRTRCNTQSLPSAVDQDSTRRRASLSHGKLARAFYCNESKKPSFHS